MTMKTMDVIQVILEHLDKSMDEERVDVKPISHEALGISLPRWGRIIEMMQEEMLIDGFHEVRFDQATFPHFRAIEPRITMTGIRFLADNTNMAKIIRAAKEIKNIIPGI